MPAYTDLKVNHQTKEIYRIYRLNDEFRKPDGSVRKVYEKSLYLQRLDYEGKLIANYTLPHGLDIKINFLASDGFYCRSWFVNERKNTELVYKYIKLN